MNKEIRLLLIERARIKIPIAYGVIMQQLELNNNLREHREILKEELAAISHFEHSRKRPMLSSMAMYEGGKKIGHGFYPLAEELGYGNAKQLEKQKFAFEMQRRCHQFWTNYDNYRLYKNDSETHSSALLINTDLTNKNVVHSFGGLTRKPVPSEGFNKVPIRNFDFKELEIDWEAKNKENSVIGLLGEQLVIDFEKEFLRHYGYQNYADDVHKVKDGLGYDIFSRNLDGSEKKIEVKTTIEKYTSPFPISVQEIKFSELNSDSYSLYRVFNLNMEKRIGEFHEFKGDLNSHFLFEPIQFNAFKKSDN